MLRRLVLSAASVLLVAGTAAGCVGSPAPVETTPAFASEDEAFAAAEQTYRSYVDALNQVDLADPATFEPVFALTTGEANASARESFSRMHADGWSVVGESKFDNFKPKSFEPPLFVAELCLDVTDVAVTDASGASVVPPERVDRQPALVTFIDQSGRVAIQSSEAIESDLCG